METASPLGLWKTQQEQETKAEGEAEAEDRQVLIDKKH